MPSSEVVMDSQRISGTHKIGMTPGVKRKSPLNGGHDAKLLFGPFGWFPWADWVRETGVEGKQRE